MIGDNSGQDFVFLDLIIKRFAGNPKLFSCLCAVEVIQQECLNNAVSLRYLCGTDCRALVTKERNQFSFVACRVVVFDQPPDCFSEFC